MNGVESRRAFLRRSAALGLAGAAAPFVGSLAAIGEAAAATATDYKALVCVFLHGGNDHANTVVPFDETSYASYRRARPNLAHQRTALEGTLLRPSTELAGGRKYALSPSLGPLMPIFNERKLAVILNLGTLVEPTSKSQYLARSVRLPPKLFSHNDQQSYFQASNPEGATSGWGGRMGDLFQAGNGSSTLTCISTSGNAVYLSGRSAVQYSVGIGGPVALIGNSKSLYGSQLAATALRSLVTGTSTNMLADEHARVGKRALDTYAQVSEALAKAPVSNFSRFEAGNSLSDQLKTVARLISVASTLGSRRQVFFVSLGGFDLHDNLISKHDLLMATLAEAMRSFYDTTVALGVQDSVTTFTASDFGRTLQANEDGSDHGWGSMHFVLGGAVNGGRFYGNPPDVGNDTADDVGQGRLIPTLSVDQYASTLSSWFGVTAGEMSTVLPNIGNFDQSTHSLGFV